MQVISDIIDKIYLSIEGNGFQLLDNIGNISESIFEISPLKLILESNVNILIHSVTLFIILLFLSYTIYSLLFSKKAIYYFGFKSFIQVILISILSLNSFGICREIVIINNTFTVGIGEMFENITGEKVEYNSLKTNIDSIEEYLERQDKINISGIKDVIVSVVFVLILSIFSMRYVLCMLCILTSPFIILLLLFKKTNYLFSLWLKYFLTSLFVQNINKTLLFICISAKSEKELYGCILLGTILLLYVINKRIGEL